MKTIFGLAYAFWVVLLFPVTTSAQSYAVNWFAIDGGGGNSAGGGYSLAGSVGQADAGLTMSGGSFALTGGFWSIVAVQTAGAPLLKIFLTRTNTAVISWPSASTGFALQQNGQLGTSNWVATGQTLNDNGTNKFVIVNPPSGNRYYRLFKP
jgi:hypothetical protein